MHQGWNTIVWDEPESVDWLTETLEQVGGSCRDLAARGSAVLLTVT